MISILKGCYPYFSLFALIVILWRIKVGAWNRRETLVLVCFLAHLLLELLQVVVGDGKWSVSRRYLLPVAPLLFAWTAYGAWKLYEQFKWKVSLRTVSVAVTVAAIVFLYDGLSPSLKSFYSKRKKGEAGVLAIASDVIRKNYTGIPEDDPPLNKLMYRSPYRPVVFSSFPALGFFSGGRSEPSPFEEKADFSVLPASAASPLNAEKIHAFSVQGFHYVIYRNGK